MAQIVERGILEGIHTIVEAGTGVGKSLAYLVPAVRSGKKIVLSTGTIALQEQLVRKDIPLVSAALGVPLRVTLLKGRGHYLCKQKFERMRADRLVASSRSMQRLWEWAGATETGDRAELTFVPNAGEWEQLDADADDCVGEFCSHFRDCFSSRSATKQSTADIVVVNHALFFLDLGDGRRTAAAVRRRGARRGASVRTLGDRRADRDALARDDRPDDAQAASRLRPCRRRSICASTKACARWSRRFARVPGERYPLAANDAAWPALERVARRSVPAWRTGFSPTGTRRSNTCRRTTPKPNGGAIWRCASSSRIGADRSRASAVGAGDRVGRARRLGWTLQPALRAVRRRRVSAGDALRAYAERRADERDDRDRRSSFSSGRSASTKRKS